MKRSIILAVLIIAASVSGFAQKPGDKSDQTAKAKHEVIALVSEYANAFVKGDGATMDRIVSDDYLDVNAGLVTDKSLLTRVFEDGGRVPVVFRLGENSLFRSFGNAAVLITDATLKWPESDKLGWNSRYMITFVAAMENGRWRLVSTNESAVETAVILKVVDVSTGQAVVGNYIIIERIAHFESSKCPATPCPLFRKVIFSGDSDKTGAISVPPVVLEPTGTIRVEHEITANGYDKQPLRIEKNVIKLSRRKADTPDQK